MQGRFVMGRLAKENLSKDHTQKCRRGRKEARDTQQNPTEVGTLNKGALHPEPSAMCVTITPTGAHPVQPLEDHGARQPKRIGVRPQP